MLNGETRKQYVNDADDSVGVNKVSYYIGLCNVDKVILVTSPMCSQCHSGS